MSHWKDDAAFGGLSTAEAKKRLAQFGPNELPDSGRRSFLRIVVEIASQPMFALLIIGAVVYLLLGEASDAILLAAFATFSVSIGIVQESRSEKVLESLRNLASPRALVIRDGEHRRIAGRDVVPDDIMILGEGDRVPADAILVSGNDLLADESLLTGESVPVRKRPSGIETASIQPGGEDLPFVFAGTLIVRGHGLARVTATGLASEMGKIGQALKTISFSQPHLQQQLVNLVRSFALIGITAALLVVILFGYLRGDWLHASLAGIAIGMSVLPEEIPLVLAVFMAMGAWRISRAGVLTRRAAAIETLGSATVLCTDKTGTLTENRMRVELVAADGDVWRREAGGMSGAIRAVVEAALGASAVLPVDPMDKAIHEIARAAEITAPPELVTNFGLRPDLFAVTNIWRDEDGSARAFVKGAPEAVAELCGFSQTEKERVLRDVDDYASEGVRLLAVAAAALDPSAATIVASPRDIDFVWQGLIGFADPLRPTVPNAIKECREAGIRVVMITGDYPVTAQAIAAEAGIDSQTVISGEQIEKLSDPELALAMKTTSVFARIRPQQKLRIVEALKQDGEIVAMTGDGVNDAPAMKAAHIGISMGGRGTDVAREASALVLLQDEFPSIVSTIRLGRRIYDNLRKALEYIVAVHIPIAGLALLPFFFGLPLVLLPLQIALLEMVIDPACSIVFESEKPEPNVMRRPPRPPNMPLFSRNFLLWAILQGAAALFLLGLALYLGGVMGRPENELRALVFSLLVLINVGLIFLNRTFGSSLWRAVRAPNPALWILLVVVFCVLAVAIYWPPAQTLFHFAPLPARDVALNLGAALLFVLLLEFGKRIPFVRRAF